VCLLANFGDSQVQILFKKHSGKELYWPTIISGFVKSGKKVVKKVKITRHKLVALKEKEYAQEYIPKFQKSQIQHFRKVAKVRLYKWI